VKWCSVCGKWDDHFRAGHPVEEEPEEAEEPAAGNVGIIEDMNANNGVLDVDLEHDGAFARLRRAGFI